MTKFQLEMLSEFNYVVIFYISWKECFESMLVLLLMYLSKQTVTESINRIMTRTNSIKPSLLTLLFLLIVLLCIYMSKKVDDASIEM